MAHPLTQQPPSSLPFPFAARPSPLSFGFGLPTSPSAFTSPVRGVSWSSPTPSPSRAPRFRSETTSTTLKRSRRSRSPSSSPPLIPSSPASTSSQARSAKVDLSVLALQDGPSKSAKRTCLVPGVNQQTSVSGDVDAGILLATLPPSAHLPILLQILQSHPSLTDEVIGQIPQPDVKHCIREISTAFEGVQRAAGGGIGVRGGSQMSELRRWDRVRAEVEVFCRTASTYIRYFTSSKSPIATEAIFTFLHPLTASLQVLLQLVPSNADATNPVLDLAHIVLSAWTLWVESLSTEVNQHGGMYPHSLVASWADVLVRITVRPESAAPYAAHWSVPTPQPQPHEDSTPFEDSFRKALLPVKVRFLAELGWMIGRTG
ncbi:uncharacterized protein I303_101020 [Kwoniella dejecticola CBS 10117]|uniref:Tethering factor for nuclear proteasome STS1 n=1 Tax=Kwoniella dejecticola CBS 10117 TaxID=1296121 RepID=A0A1A6AGK0_9TREE|nr:uncharacterized protein I303_01024 [Kwoniella dejecticola CBS 10117]OBR89199.1 hypothetical protein I303_01024 [Kwoniella dejecticola CBS 10117]